MQRLEVFLLGETRVELDGTVIKPGNRKSFALLAFLAVTRERYRRESLLNLLWPESEETKARALLRNSLHDLNKTLGADWIKADREVVFLRSDAGLWVDVNRFRDLLAGCGSHGHGETVICPSCMPPLKEALELYRSDFLAGFSLKDSINFDDWQRTQSQNLRTDMVSGFEGLIRFMKAEGDLKQAIGYAQRWLGLDGLNEVVYRELMDLQARSGQRTAALQVYQDCKSMLENELGVSPEPATVELYEAIRENQVEVTQLAARIDDPSHNLPRRLSSFIGRDKELAEIKKLLPGTALLTLTGAGGCGKTRLALKLASEVLGKYPEGVWLVELASVSDPKSIPRAVASVFELREQKDYPLRESLMQFFKTKQLLLILDNCEHLIQACAEFTDMLLRGCPKLRILITSRETLNLEGETAWRLPSLSVPDTQHIEYSSPSELIRFEAVRLFGERAGSALPGFEITGQNAHAVARICRRLDGIPLAVELAAKKVTVLTPEQILGRLDGHFQLLTGGSRTALPRQQTLRATLDWSYALLSEKEQILLHRLAVFSGGWTLEAAEAVCVGSDDETETAIRPAEIISLLTGLVDKSMVSMEEKQGEARYSLLETIKQYGREKLQQAGEEIVMRNRYKNWCVELAERAETEVKRADQVYWLDRLDRERENLGAAIQLCLTDKDAEAGLRIGGSLWWSWFLRGYLIEGREILEQFLSMSSSSRSTVTGRTLAKAMVGACSFSAWLGKLDRATELGEASFTLYRKSGDKSGMAFSLAILAEVAQYRGDNTRAKGLLDGSLKLLQGEEDKWGIAFAYTGLKDVFVAQNDLERAQAMMEKCLALLRELGVRIDVGLVMIWLALVLVARGDYKRADELLLESLEICRELGHRQGIALALLVSGIKDSRQGKYSRAGTYLKESMILLREASNKSFIAWCFLELADAYASTLRPELAVRLFSAADKLDNTLSDLNFEDFNLRVASLRDKLDKAVFTTAWEEGRAMTMHQAIEYALAGEIP